MNRREEVDRGSEFHRIPGCGCGLRLLTCRPSPGSVVGRAAAFHSWGGGTGRWDENGGGTWEGPSSRFVVSNGTCPVCGVCQLEAG
jgi:hypothetical protein